MNEMSRDHRRLHVFNNAHRLPLRIYKETSQFPKDEWFGLRIQIRRAAVSVAANIVEGSARKTEREYCNFLNIAVGSASELAYLLQLASELYFVPPSKGTELRAEATTGVCQLKRLLAGLEGAISEQPSFFRASRPRANGAPRPKA